MLLRMLVWVIPVDPTLSQQAFAVNIHFIPNEICCLLTDEIFKINKPWIVQDIFVCTKMMG